MININVKAEYSSIRSELGGPSVKAPHRRFTWTSSVKIPFHQIWFKYLLKHSHDLSYLYNYRNNLVILGHQTTNLVRLDREANAMTATHFLTLFTF